MAVAGDRVGIDRVTGAALTDWAHCVQSINDIFTTRFNERTMLLEYGQGPMDLLDRPGNKQVIASWYGKLTMALMKWEPGYRVLRFSIDQAGSDGQFAITMDGLFYPRGHLGDYSVFEAKNLVMSLPTLVI